MLGDFTTDLMTGAFTLPGFMPTTGAGSNPALGTDVKMPDGSIQHFAAVQDANGNYVSPKIFISDSIPGGFAAAMPGTPEYDHYSSVMARDNTQGVIKVAALVGGAAAAGAFFGSAAASDVADTATAAPTAATAASTAAETGAELTPIELPATATLLPTTVAPTILSPTATLLSMPAFDAGAVAPLADQLVNAVNTPEMQAAIAAGDVPPPPGSLLSGNMTQWATSTGIKYLEQQLGRTLTASEQKTVEAQMAAEIQKLQAQLAANGQGAYSPNGSLSSYVQSLMNDAATRDQFLEYVAIGGLILAGTWMLTS
jgi:hypothetical protein